MQASLARFVGKGQVERRINEAEAAIVRDI